MEKVKTFFKRRWDDLIELSSSQTLLQKIRDVIVGWLMWWFGLWIICLIMSGGDIKSLFPHMNFARSGFKWMLAFYPANLYMFHGTYIETDKERKAAEARIRGKRFYTYHPGETHLIGGIRMLLLYALCFFVVGIADEILPKFLWNIFICIPIIIHFFPELKAVYKRITRSLENGKTKS